MSHLSTPFALCRNLSAGTMDAEQMCSVQSMAPPHIKMCLPNKTNNLLEIASEDCTGAPVAAKLLGIKQGAFDAWMHGSQPSTDLAPNVLQRCSRSRSTQQDENEMYEEHLSLSILLQAPLHPGFLLFQITFLSWELLLRHICPARLRTFHQVLQKQIWHCWLPLRPG